MGAVNEIYPDARPYVRWWWFRGPVSREAVSSQLEWARDNCFGGVEISWVYPLPENPGGPEWLSGEWSDIVAYTSRRARELGLGCDFTFGSLWPFGGSCVRDEHVSVTFNGPSKQRLRKSWETPERGECPILNHLDRAALEEYSRVVGGALKRALDGGRSALFCDSWEVHVEKLWTTGFGEAFKREFGYEVEPYMETLDEYPDVRYDYRRLVGRYVIDEFYKPFVRICRELGSVARVQCHGAPTDLIAAYAAVDVPESEAVLFDPFFSRFAASAAALAGKTLVSAEAFTCLYGWVPFPGPGPHNREEKTVDLKLVADALFANGVNFIVWHGMPWSPGGNNDFYATVHVGPGGALANDLKDFNAYMEKVSELMREGRPFTGSAAYLPLEDVRMADRLPEDMKRPSAEYYWELQHLREFEELEGYHPTWVSAAFLEKADVKNGVMKIGDAEFSFLYVASEWLDAATVDEITRLAEAGLPVCLKRRPSEPGRNRTEDYEDKVERLFSFDNVKTEFYESVFGPPLVMAKPTPEFHCRVIEDGLLFFFAHPMSREVTYPMRYGQSETDETVRVDADLNVFGKAVRVPMVFEPGQSLVVEVDSGGGYSFVDIEYAPGGDKGRDDL